MDAMADQRSEANAAVLVGSGVALGLILGMILKDAASEAVYRMRNRQWRREYKRSLAYRQNLPASLARREPPPEPGQPRFGGTGALGVHPAAGTGRP
jgi:hypothetical protein